MTDQDIDALYRSAEQRWMLGWLAGPTLEGNPLRRGDQAPDVELLDEEGARVSLASIWGSRPGLVLLWRHLGCGCGLERAGRLKTEYQDYLASGLNVVIVAPGDVERVARYKERYQIEAPMLIDPEYAAHKAFGLGHWSVEQALYDAPDEYCELEEDTGLNQANLSRHLQLLSTTRLVRRRKEGLFVYYALADRGVLRMCELMCGRLNN